MRTLEGTKPGVRAIRFPLWVQSLLIPRGHALWLNQGSPVRSGSASSGKPSMMSLLLRAVIWGLCQTGSATQAPSNVKASSIWKDSTLRNFYWLIPAPKHPRAENQITQLALVHARLTLYYWATFATLVWELWRHKVPGLRMRSGCGSIWKLKHEDKIPGLLRVDPSKLRIGRNKTHKGMKEMTRQVKERTEVFKGRWTDV